MQKNMCNEFLDPIKNTMFSKLRGIDLQDLIVTIENFYLVYRRQLLFSETISFGVELEYEGISKRKVDKFINNNLVNWVSKFDDSLDSGGEVTSPISYNEESTWKDIKKVCTFFRQMGADTFHNAGGHIHVSNESLKTPLDYEKYLKYYAVYEFILWRFSYGDKLNGRRKQKYFASPAAKIIKKFQKNIEKSDSIETTRGLISGNVAINCDTDKPTTEYRLFNCESDNEIVLQNNINTVINSLLAVCLNKVDFDYINYKFENEMVSESMYDEIFLYYALEFVDTNFNNNLDKVYFLRQYLRNFQSGYGASTTLKAKTFVKLR